MPQDRQTYSELDKTAWAYLPSLVRWRQRYRGKRESLKINQEASQILYDIYNANKRIDVLFEKMEAHAAELFDGKEFDDVEYLYGSDETPSTYNSVGIKDLSDRLTRLDNMLKDQRF